MLVGCCSVPARLAAQEGNRFGTQSRADAARQMIVLAVWQGISSLPPTSGQSSTYDFDARLDTYTKSPLLGPTALRSTQTVGEHNLSFRAAFSYFELAQTFGPVDYKITGNDYPDPPGSCIWKRLGSKRRTRWC